MAAAAGRTDLLELLLQHGANLWKRDKVQLPGSCGAFAPPAAPACISQLPLPRLM
jgi:hypothetical protein